MRIFVVLAGMLGLAAQPLTAPQAQQLMTRSVQLMESAGVALPELARAGAPLVENARQAIENAQSTSANLQFYNLFQSNLRAYLFVADSLPKPTSFPEQARQQLAELRDNFSRLDTFFATTLAQRDLQLRSSDRDNLNRYAEADSKLPAPRPENSRVVFMGDSITDFWRLNEYFGERDFVNRGISGQITGQMLGRMMADAVNLHPQAILILGGTNDLARGVALLAVENNLTMIADLADHYKIKVIFAAVTPVSDYHKDVDPNYERTKERSPSLIRSLNGWIKSICSDRGYTYLDYFNAMVDSTGMMKADLADDGLHPNSAGYRIMAPLALDAINKTVGAGTGPTQREPRKRRLFSK